MAKILLGFDILDDGLERLEQAHTLIRPPRGRDFSQAELKELLPECDVLCSVFDLPVGADLLQGAKRLKLVANYAVGYNNIDIEYARTHGIAVTNTPRSVVEPTAELAMALILTASRRTAELDRAIRRADGGRLGIGRLGMLATGLRGKTVGIVGYGNIGGSVARKCQAFGMEILYYKRTRLPEEVEQERGITYVPLDELLQRSDVVSLHTPYSPEAHHQIGARELEMMKPSAILINTARGSIVDEDALIHALETGQIWAAGLDVFEDADIPRPQLRQMPNVVMTPHVGTQTYEARVEMMHEMIDCILDFLSGKDIHRIV